MDWTPLDALARLAISLAGFSSILAALRRSPRLAA
jgi:hypothetical protein